MRQRPRELRFVSAVVVLPFLAALGTCPAWGQGNSAAAHWVLQNVPPGQRGEVISQAAHGTSVIPTSTPTATPTATATNTWTATTTPTSTPTDTPDPRCAGRSDGETCDAGVDYQATSLCVGGACQTCVPDAGAAPRFVDNADGTVTDRKTCLVWEKKDDSGSIHDKDDRYVLSLGTTSEDCTPDCTVPGCPPNGGAFTVFLATLNATSFAGHHDWRLPTSQGRFYSTGQPAELESLFASTSCGPDPSDPCVDPIFDTNCGDGTINGVNEGCTIDGSGAVGACSCTGGFYWSSSTETDYANNDAPDQGVGEYSSIFVQDAPKTCTGNTRAVRGGPTANCVPTTCVAQGASCGAIADGCNGIYGTGGTLDCGSCSGFDTCGGGGVPNQCGCTDNGLACSNAGQVCGTRVNNCGQQVSCGTCPADRPKCCFESCVESTMQCP